jgi:hypothetical protein
MASWGFIGARVSSDAYIACCERADESYRKALDAWSYSNILTGIPSYPVGYWKLLLLPIFVPPVIVYLLARNIWWVLHGSSRRVPSSGTLADR